MDFFYMLKSVELDFVYVIPYMNASIVLVQEACCGRWSGLAASDANLKPNVCKCASAWNPPKQQLSDFCIFELQFVSESTPNWTKECVKDETSFFFVLVPVLV